MARITNTGTTLLRVNFRAPGKLYNMTTGNDATAASPHPFDTANINPGDSLDIEGEILGSAELPGESAPTGVEAHISPAEFAAHNPQGPSE